MPSDHDVARWRLASQHLVVPYAPSARDVVQHLVAVQAENPGQAAWAVASRSATPDRDELRAALDRAEVVRTHVLRPTWHFVRGEDVGWLLELTAPRVRPTVLRQLQQVHGLGTPDLDRLRAAVLDALTETPDQTREELAACLPAAGVTRPGAVLTLLLALLELEALVCSGRPRDGSHTYAVFEHRVAARRQPDRSAALAELALRYFTGHGPATEKDLAYWATLTVTDVRHGLEQVRDRLACFEHRDRTLWHAAAAEPPRGPLVPAGHLLQILDEVYRGYQDTRMVLDAEGVVPPGRETTIGMALVDGQMVAGMRRTVGRRVVFALTPYRGDLGAAERAALERAAIRYGAFLGLDHELVVA